ncbi:hypothetical protein EJ05DRAFT_504138 [Pseudovirgaria hyperparasitica]|uniref:Uncharacterized protein n=1 Tax=Pseudovirgaria hyperparasitica TaxID=470096 RepID=A0A6A6W0L5_9PEZI|nr:uncharacterized protein EJ05DRAFT_504138 [Pseudovirgaria hyperparasitica]KAF2754611.1 hypothetical protein EJ05DRAFT_504138 [Pseudovirgaria hyperparasitica]
MFKAAISPFKATLAPQTPKRRDSTQPADGSSTVEVLAEISGNLYAPAVTSSPANLLSPPNFHTEDLQQRFLVMLRERDKLKSKIEQLESILQRALVTIRALKLENRHLSDDAQTYQAAYLESQDYLDHLLRSCEHFISDPAAFIKLRTLPAANQEDLKADWDRASWISVLDTRKQLVEIETEMDKKEYCKAGEKIDEMLREEDIDPFLVIDLHLLKSLVLRGLYFPQEALEHAQNAVSICEGLRQVEQLTNDVAFNYLAKTKYFYAKCLYPVGKSESVSAALQCAAVVDGDEDSEEIKLWKTHVWDEWRKFGFEDDKLAERPDQSEQASISTKSDETGLVLVANTTKSTSHPSKRLSDFTDLLKGMPQSTSRRRRQSHYEDTETLRQTQRSRNSSSKRPLTRSHPPFSTKDVLYWVSEFELDPALDKITENRCDTSPMENIGCDIDLPYDQQHHQRVLTSIFEVPCIV